MKNLFTICALFIAALILPESGIHAKPRSHGNIKWSVVHPDRQIADLFVWESSLISATVMMPTCPDDIEIDLLPGECGVIIPDFGFGSSNLPDLVDVPVSHNPNTSQATINATIYCSSGQTKYSRVFTNFGPTDLNLQSINIGVYEAINDPLVKFNFYLISTGELLGSVTEIIPSPMFTDVHTINIAAANIKIPSLASYRMEVVTNAPQISVFKIGRNDLGNAPGYSEATFVAANCPTFGSLSQEIDSGIPNSVVFSASGILDDYKFINSNPLTNGLEEGDYFGHGIYSMVFHIANSTGLALVGLPAFSPQLNICSFVISINEFQIPNGAIACNDLVQVSLDDKCEAIVTADMLLEGDQYGCYDNYTVQIIGNNGVNLNNKVTKANIGQTLKTLIIAPDGNSCWGEILVEDKFGPQLVCSDIYTTCATDLRPGSPISARVPVAAHILDGTIDAITVNSNTTVIDVNDVQGSVITDLNVYLDISHTRVSDLAANITSPDGVTVPLFLNVAGCNGQNLMATFDDESANNIQCEVSLVPSIAGIFKPLNALSIFDGKKMKGQWKVTIFDQLAGHGGTVNNVHLIFRQSGGILPFPTPKDITFNYLTDNTYIVKGIDECSDATLTYTDEVIEEECSSIYSKVIKRCWTGFDVKGNPANPCCQKIYVYRNSLSTLTFPLNFDGLPGNNLPLTCALYGTTIPPTSLTGLPAGDFCDNVQIAPPVDTKIDICKKSYKLLRTHKVIDWCSGQVIIHNQIIKVLDQQGPELECPKNVTISTDDYTCSATYQVPRPVVSNECSDILTYHLSYSSIALNDPDYITTNVNQATGTISGLPVGFSWLQWVVTDECGNSSSCRFRVAVEDKVRPTAVCDQFTVAAITGNGRAIVDASTFDDGSTDNCGILKFEARKMTDLCGFGTSVFTPWVEFCCEEVNTSVMVEMRVTDVNNNTNTCMVEVRVQDKLPPYITKCPADITLECHADYNDLLVTGEPMYVDNCEVVSVKHQDDVRVTQCGVGTVTRTWTVEDKQGYRHSCVQIITLIDSYPFYVNISNHLDPYDDIIWPLNYETKKCHSVLDPASLPAPYDKPTFSDDNCSLVAIHYKDQVFKFVDGACEKILRTWTVIDWCTYRENEPGYNHGIYEYVQIIKLLNDIPPSFEFACEDRTIASFGNCEELVDFTMTAVDDCPENNTNLSWKYELFTETGLIPIAVVNSDRFFRTLANGKYRIKWTVEDKCGNRAFCTHYIDVVESKKPTPYCISSLTTAVMNSNGTIGIWAKDYDKGAFDNCTPQNELWFTFYGATPVESLIDEEHYFIGYGELASKSDYEAGYAQIWKPLSKTSGILFDCEDIPNGISQEVNVEVWVTDLAGNQDYCTVTLVLQDNANFCTDGNPDLIAINGKVLQGTKAIKGANITLGSNVFEQNRNTNSDANGTYNFPGLPKSKNYTVSISDNRDILNGVSTLDLVIIQRHILALEELNDPKKIIAADVDNNTKVTAADLVALRKNILGLTNEFPNDQKSWRFVTANHVFSNPSNPFPFTEKYAFDHLTSNKISQNFFAIKIGDINNSASINATESVTEPRSKNLMVLETETVDAKAGDDIIVPVYANTFDDVFGYQFTIRFDESAFTFTGVNGESLSVNDANFGFNRTDKGIITTSWNNDNAVSLSNGQKLFTMRFKAKKNIKTDHVIIVNSEVTPAVAYDSNYNAMGVSLTKRSDNTPSIFDLKQNIPNPFHDQTLIAFTLGETGAATITITDITGKMVKVIKGQYTKGEHSILLNKNELGTSGVLMYKIESGKYTDTKKMIIIE